MSQTARTIDVREPHQLRPIMDVGKTFGLLESELISYGPYKAKIHLDALKRLENRPDGRLVVVTAIEVAISYLEGDVSNTIIVTLLLILAIVKFSTVALYFMHLRFETKTLGWIAVTPLAIATLLVFVLLPDGFAVLKTTDASKKAAATTPAKH